MQKFKDATAKYIIMCGVEEAQNYELEFES